MESSAKMASNDRLAPLRAALRAATGGDETAGVEALLEGYPVNARAREAAQLVAKTIVTASRAMSADRGTLDAFLQEFGLSNQEGVALIDDRDFRASHLMSFSFVKLSRCKGRP